LQKALIALLLHFDQVRDRDRILDLGKIDSFTNHAIFLGVHVSILKELTGQGARILDPPAKNAQSAFHNRKNPSVWTHLRLGNFEHGKAVAQSNAAQYYKRAAEQIAGKRFTGAGAGALRVIKS